MTYTVFVSSTYLDNVERREIVEDAILRAGLTPIGMERFALSEILRGFFKEGTDVATSGRAQTFYGHESSLETL